MPLPSVPDCLLRCKRRFKATFPAAESLGVLARHPGFRPGHRRPRQSAQGPASHRPLRRRRHGLAPVAPALTQGTSLPCATPGRPLPLRLPGKKPRHYKRSKSLTPGYTILLQSPQTAGGGLPRMDSALTAHDSPKVPSTSPPSDGHPLHPTSPGGVFFARIFRSGSASRHRPGGCYKWRGGPPQTVTQGPRNRHRRHRRACLECIHALTAHDSPKTHPLPPWMGLLSNPAALGGVFFCHAVTRGHQSAWAVTGRYREATDALRGPA